MKSPRLILAVLIASAIQCVAGCAAWQARKWDLSHLRDPRATDLEDRLTSRQPPIGNAFSDATDQNAPGADGN